MHEVHKRVHDPQLVKHLPGRNHKANLVHLEGCGRERCGVGSETLLFVKWNTLISKSIWTKYFSETYLTHASPGALLSIWQHFVPLQFTYRYSTLGICLKRPAC